MRSTYKRFAWRATRPVNTADCVNEGRYCLKCIITDILILYFKKISPLITTLTIRRNYRTRDPPKSRL